MICEKVPACLPEPFIVVTYVIENYRSIGQTTVNTSKDILSPPNLDVKKLRVRVESSVCLVSKHLFCQHFAQLYTLLIEAVQIPQESLEHYLVLIMCKQCSHSFRCQLLSNDDA